MSTVLTKPVLLDETGQSIVDKLDEIKDAIGSSGEFTPVQIKVTTPPTKTNYFVGDNLDLSGIVVKLEASNGALIDVTEQCVFSPADGAVLASTDTSVSITYHWYKDNVDFTASQRIVVGDKNLVSIAVTTPPTVTEYMSGDTLDLTGLVITATLSDGSTEDVTNLCTYNPADGATLTTEDDSIDISYTFRGTTKTTSQSIVVQAPIYGAEWDGTSSTAWTRTDAAANFTDPVPYVSGASSYSSPFDDILPWSGMVIEERTGGTMVKIPKFWYKLTQEGAGIKIQISSKAVEGFNVSPAHMDRGDGNGERDYVYVGRYHCGATAYKSASGQSPKVSVIRANFRTQIHALGSNIWQMDFATRFTLWLLYIVEFADWNSQTKIGYGCGNNSSTQAMGYTDSMPYHTGTTQASRTTYGLGTQYRYIEGLWDNVYDWVDGCYYNSNGLNIILNPANFSDSSGGVLVGKPSSGYPSAFSLKDVANTFELFIPTAANGSNSTYSCDNWYFSGSDSCLCAGGYYYQGLGHGLFCVYCADASYASAYHGSRLMELPNNA